MYPPDEPIPQSLPFLIFPTATVKQIFRATVSFNRIGNSIIYSVSDNKMDRKIGLYQIILVAKKKCKIQNQMKEAGNYQAPQETEINQFVSHLTTHPITNILVCSCNKLVCWHMFSVLVHKK